MERSKMACSRQKASTSCSSAGRSTWAGTGRYIWATSVGAPLRIRSTEGRSPLGRRGTTLLGALGVARARSFARPRPVLLGAVHGGPNRSSGGSGVIFATSPASGLTPPPDRCRLRTWVLVPIDALLTFQPVYGAGLTAVA